MYCPSNGPPDIVKFGRAGIGEDPSVYATVDGPPTIAFAAFAGFKTVSVGTVAITIATRKRTNTEVLPIIF
jgi:hypothetical protein